MIEIIKNSFLFKFAVNTVELYKKGKIHSTIEATKKHYKTSKTKVLWEQFVAKNSAYKTSIYNKILMRLSYDLVKIGDIYQNSIIKKIFEFFIALYIKITKDSLVFRPLHKLGVKGTLLVAFGLYLPLDYFLRSVVNIAILSSLWDELLFILFIAVILYRKATKKVGLETRVTPLDGYLFMFIAMGLFLMCYMCPVFSIALDGYRAVVQYILWFFAVVRLIEDDKDFQILYNTLIAMIFFIGLHGIYQFIIGVDIPDTWMTSSEESVRTRVFSLTGSPNVMGSIIVLMTPMITAIAYKSKNLKVQLASWGVTILMCMCLLFTFSKGAWFGMVVAVIVFAIFLDRRIIALLLGAGTTVLIAVPSVVNRITYLFTEEYIEASLAGGRMMRWEVGLSLLDTVNPWFGFGLGRFGGAVAMQNQVLETVTYFYMDNYYLKTLVEMGYLGLGFYILLLVAFVIVSIKAIGKVRNTEFHAQTVGIFSGMCGVLVHLYYENIFEVPYMTGYFWAMAAMIMYVGFLRKNKNK